MNHEVHYSSHLIIGEQTKAQVWGVMVLRSSFRDRR